MNERKQEPIEQILNRIDAREAVCGVLGLGFIGSTLMDAIVNAGYRVRGFDRSCEAVNRFRLWMAERNSDSTAMWSAGTDPAILAGAEVIIVAVRLLPRDDGGVDQEPLEAAAAILRPHIIGPRLILLESTVPCGMTRCFAESLGQRAGLFVAHSPERLSVGQDRRVFRSTPHLLGGVDAEAGRVGARFLSTLCDRVVEVSSPEVSELSKLLENGFLTTGIALANEVTRMAHALGIAAEEVCAAAATKPSGYYPFFPGPGMGGHCLGNDLKILISTANQFGAASPLLSAVAAAAMNGPELVMRRLEGLLLAHGSELHDRRVLLVGVGFKPGTSDTTGSPAIEIARLLRKRGAVVCYLDSQVREFAVDGQSVERMEDKALEGTKLAATVIVAGDRSTTFNRLIASSEFVLDARGRNQDVRPDGVHTL